MEEEPITVQIHWTYCKSLEEKPLLIQNGLSDDMKEYL